MYHLKPVEPRGWEPRGVVGVEARPKGEASRAWGSWRPARAGRAGPGLLAVGKGVWWCVHSHSGGTNTPVGTWALGAGTTCRAKTADTTLNMGVYRHCCKVCDLS